MSFLKESSIRQKEKNLAKVFAKFANYPTAIQPIDGDFRRNVDDRFRFPASVNGDPLFLGLFLFFFFYDEISRRLR